MEHKKPILNTLKWFGIVFLVIAVIIAVIIAINTDFSSPDNPDVFIERKIAKADIPGISIAMINGDKITSSWQAGFADAENQIPVTKDTLFQIASTSKTVTGTAVMQLYERGLLDLDDDINQYLPFTILHPQYPDNPISFRRLLNHTAGMKDNWNVYDSFYTISTGGGD